MAQPDAVSTLNDAQSSKPGLVLKILMQGKEVGSIIGKKGDNVRRYREESGARINISDGSSPERVVMVAGSMLQVQQALGMICRKLEEDASASYGAHATPLVSHNVTIKLLVPGSQCGSLIGKGGVKIKEIREASGAAVQVASDPLPGSTERMVTLCGTAEAIAKCISHISTIMSECPSKGTSVPYRPRPAATAAAAASAAASPQPQLMYATASATAASSPQPQLVYTTAAACAPSYAVPLTAISGDGGRIISEMPVAAMSMPQISTMSNGTQFLIPHAFLSGMGLVSVSALGRASLTRGRRAGGYLTRQMSSPSYSSSNFGSCSNSNSSSSSSSSSSAGGISPASPTAALMSQQATKHMAIPNELIGCIIGRGGAKINEIRQLSGAQIKISNSEEGSSERKITITGLPENVTMASYMISSSFAPSMSILPHGPDARSAAAAKSTCAAIVSSAPANAAALSATATAPRTATSAAAIAISSHNGRPDAATALLEPLPAAGSVHSLQQALITAASYPNYGGRNNNNGSSQLCSGGSIHNATGRCFHCRAVARNDVVVSPLPPPLRLNLRFFPY